MVGLSHNQIVDAITEIASPVMAAALSQDAMVDAESDEDASSQIRAGVIEALKHRNLEPLACDHVAAWPNILAKTSRHNRLIFIALVRAIYS